MDKETKKLAWVRGNDVVLAVTLARKYTDDGGNPHEELIYFDTVDNISVCAVNAIGKREELSFSLRHGDSSQLLVKCPYTMTCGNYSLDITFIHGEIHERSCEACVFSIVSTNDMANVTLDILDGYQSATLDIKYSMVRTAVRTGPSAYQAWLEAGNHGTLDDYVGWLYAQGNSAKEAADRANAIVASVEDSVSSVDALVNELREREKAVGDLATLLQHDSQTYSANEVNRNEAEKERIYNESERKIAEEKRNADTQLAISNANAAESSRVESEKGRVEAEADREHMEAERSLSERKRVDAENDRVSAESLRTASEVGRANAERLRETAEPIRVDAERLRVESETQRAGAEQSRVEAERLRAVSTQAAIASATEAAQAARTAAANVKDGTDGRLKVVRHGTADTTFALTPNVLHVWDEIETLDLTLAPMTEEGVLAEFCFQFSTPAGRAVTLILPREVKWFNGYVIPIEEGRTYQASIVNNIIVMGGVSVSY